MIELTTLFLVLLAPVPEGDLYRNASKILVGQGQETLTTIVVDGDYWQEHGTAPDEVQLSLAYRHLKDHWREAVKPDPWKWVAEAGTHSLLVLETTGDDLSRWSLRQFLWKNDRLTEIPPIRGQGETFYFRDFNGDGSLEFVTIANVENLPRNEKGIPISSHVYWFDGKKYRPTAAL